MDHGDVLRPYEDEPLRNEDRELQAEDREVLLEGRLARVEDSISLGEDRWWNVDNSTVQGYGQPPLGDQSQVQNT